MGPQISASRDAMGLRGSVRGCKETSVFPSSAASLQSGPANSELKSEFQFDSSGRLAARTVHNADGSEWETQYFYDSTGLPTRTISGMKGSTPTEVLNHYDSSGKIQKTTSSASKREIATYSYDGQGRKKKVQTSRPEEYRPNVISAGSPFESADRAPNRPGGGSATTFYDERDRPYDVEVRDEEGALIKRVFRSYDEKGNVSEEGEIMDDPSALIPAQTRAQIFQSSGMTAEDLRDQLKGLLGGHAGPYSVKYRWDDTGRLIHMTRQIFNHEEVVENSYNEHGDVAREVSRTEIGGADEAHYCEAIYSYEYDVRGNWTEKITSYRSTRDGPFTVSSRTNRQLTYD